MKKLCLEIKHKYFINIYAIFKHIIMENIYVKNNHNIAKFLTG